MLRKSVTQLDNEISPNEAIPIKKDKKILTCEENVPSFIAQPGYLGGGPGANSFII